MKILSIAIPSYNSQDYMRNCIESLLPGGEDVEILIVDDGSKDDTAKIADEYEAAYPGIVRAIHQENGGHGEAVNAGLRHATGFFYKVVDSDDWVDPKAYATILRFLKIAVKEKEPLDALFSNYVYEKQGAKHKKVVRYRNVLPKKRYFSWEDVGDFKQSQNILMHSVIYRTQLLRDCGFELPKHTFYVDNIFVYWPLPYLKKMYYLDVNFYRYFIGRGDQSVNEKVMMGRIDQQIRVNKIMIDVFKENDGRFYCENLEKYMFHYLTTIQLVSTVLLIKINTEESEEKRRDLVAYLKENAPMVYDHMNHTFLGRMTSSNSKLRRPLILAGYKIAQKWMGFN